MFIDSHCHLEMEAYDKDRDEVIKRCIDEGIPYILTVGTEEKYFNKVIDIVNRYPLIYGAIGIHPHNSKDFNNNLIKKIQTCVSDKKIVAYGEIGLDFFKNYSPKHAQIKAFESQINMAKHLNLPVIIHSRDAKDETLNIIKNNNLDQIGGVIHCFSYDRAWSKKVLDLGFYISISGTVTYSTAQNLVDVIRYTPQERILSETDAPFLAPHPYRGKRNEPSFVRYVVEKIAHIYNVPIEDVSKNILNNFRRLFLRERREV